MGARGVTPIPTYWNNVGQWLSHGDTVFLPVLVGEMMMDAVRFT